MSIMDRRGLVGGSDPQRRGLSFRLLHLRIGVVLCWLCGISAMWRGECLQGSITTMHVHLFKTAKGCTDPQILRPSS